MANSSAVAGLRDAESRALSRREPTWSNNVSGRNQQRNKAKLSGKKKRGGFILALIASLLIGGGVFLGSSNSLLAPAISNLFTSATNSQATSYSARSRVLIGHMLNNYGSPVSSSLTGLKRYNHMSSSFRQRLADNNITVEGSGKNTTLIWTKTTAHGTETVEIGANAFDSEYLNNPEFRNSYDTARRSKIVTFFDNAANKIYSKLGLSRNALKNVDPDGKNYDDIMSKAFDNDTSSLDLQGKKAAVDENDNPIYDIDENGDRVPRMDTTTEVGSSSSTSDTVDARTKANNYLSDLSTTASRATGLANAGCALAKVGNAISLSIAATEIYQSINFFMRNVESISKMMGGEGSTSGINQMLNNFTTPSSPTIPDYSSVSITNTSSSVGEMTLSGSATQSSVFQTVLGGATADLEQTSHFSFDRTISPISRVLATSSGTIVACTAPQVANAITSIAVTIGSLGTSTILKIAGDFVFGVAAQAAITGILSFLVPAIANTLFSNIYETATGKVAGEIFGRGAARANLRVGQSGSGQTPATPEVTTAYNRLTNQIAALDAEVDRLNHSPFDVTSPNTFMGSIAYSLLPLSTSQGATTLNSILRTTSKSIASISGSVSADGDNSSYMTTYGNCDIKNDAISYAKDMFCGDIVTTDPNLINIAPDDPAYVNAIYGSSNNVSCDAEGNCEVKDDSDLAKFIVACSQRNTPFDVVDTNILGYFEEGNIIIDSIPIISDAFDIFNAVKNTDNLNWANGRNCINSPENPMWNKVKYYQRYVEDQRILEQIGSTDGEAPATNPVTAFIEDFEAEHPQDFSPAGVLSTITGLPKATTEVVLAIAEYEQYLENYDPSTTIAHDDASHISSGNELIASLNPQVYDFSSEQPSKSHYALIANHIIYADVRNRSYAA